MPERSSSAGVCSAPADTIIRDERKSLFNGAIAGWKHIDRHTPLGKLLAALCRRIGVEPSTPLEKWNDKQRGVLMFGVKRGIERISKLALPVFFLLFATLIVRSLTLDGAMAGLREFLVPRWGDFTGATALAALGQAFFSLALGGTFMVIYGSYMRSEENIPKTAVLTAAADVGAALMAGLIVVPAALALGVSLKTGVPLLFEVMPEVFGKMPAGPLWGALFFGSIFLVAMLSLIAAYEVIAAAFIDGLGWSRGRVLGGVLVIELLLAVPALTI
ncbi:MAG: sodium-dependent transporter, partial [Bacteroidetes bacterium]|nr:sodium-dependent transporter [Bacteroidota bacterium]